MKPKTNRFKAASISTLVPSFVIICMGATLPLQAADDIWTNTGTSDWNTPGNWSLGRVPTKATFNDEAVINTNTGSIATISADLAAGPSGIIVGNGPSTNGRLDHTAGTAATGGGNWMKIGHDGGTGTYNIADTAGSGGTLTAYGQGSGSLTVNGQLRVGGGDAGSGGTGTMNVNTSGTVAVTSELHVGTNTGTGLVNLDNGAVTVTGATFIGNGASGGNGVIGTLNISGGSFTKATGSQLRVGSAGGNGFLTVSGGTLNNNGTSEFQVGDGAGTDGTVTLNGSGTINTGSWVSIGRSGGAGILNVNGGNFNKTGGGTSFIVGDASTGTLNQTSGTITTNGEVWIGTGVSNGNYNMSGGTFNADSWFVVGRNTGGLGKLTMTGGTINKGGANDFVVGGEGNSNGTVDFSGGLINVSAGVTNIGKNNTATGTLNMSLAADFRTSQMVVGAGTGTGTVNLNGGTLRTTGLNGGTGTSTVRFNGGTVQATGDSATFISGIGTAEIQAGGALVDTQTFNVTASQAFSGSGGLTKSGSGSLVLTGTSTYAGATLVSAGTLLVNGSIGSAVTVNSGAKLGGAGTVGAVAVNSGAFIGAGNSIGTLAASSAQINGTLEVEFDGAGAGTVDLLAVTGNLDITNAIVDFSLIGAPADDAAYVFASYGSLTGTSFASVIGDLPSGYYIDYAFNNGVTSNNIALVVPEPGAMLLCSLGVLGLLRRRR